jgi:hypothetical protein
MVEVEARVDAVDGAHPAGDLRFACATVVGEGVAREGTPEELLSRDRLQGLLAREAGDIRGRDTRPARAEPRHAIGRPGDDARPVVRCGLTPQGGLDAHPPILPLAFIIQEVVRLVWWMLRVAVTSAPQPPE